MIYLILIYEFMSQIWNCSFVRHDLVIVDENSEIIAVMGAMASQITCVSIAY